MSTKPKLHETKHPYYCESGHYFGTGSSGSPNRHYRNFSAFLSDWDGADKDYNLLFRWDWNTSEEQPARHILSLFYFIQRKGYHIAVTTDVTPEDEPAVRAFLEPHWKQMRKLWNGIA